MIRIVLLLGTGLLVASGLALLGSALLPFAREFSALAVEPSNLTPRFFRLLAGFLLLTAARWTLQGALRDRE